LRRWRQALNSLSTRARQGVRALRPAGAATRLPRSALALRLLTELAKHAAELLSLPGIGLHLLLRVPALNLEVFLEVLGARKLAGEFEAGLHVLLGEAQCLRLDLRHRLGHRARRFAHELLDLPRHVHELAVAGASLLDVAFRHLADLLRDLHLRFCLHLHLRQGRHPTRAQQAYPRFITLHLANPPVAHGCSTWTPDAVWRTNAKLEPAGCRK